MPHQNKALSNVFEAVCEKFKITGVELRIQKSHKLDGEYWGGSYYYDKKLIVVVDSFDLYWNVFALLHEIRHAWQHKHNVNWYLGEEEWDADQFAIRYYKKLFKEVPDFADWQVKRQRKLYKKYYRKPRR